MASRTSPVCPHKQRVENHQEVPDDEEWILVPPDGGRGWFILFGTLLINMLIPGTVKSFGVLFIEFLEVFDATPLAASWIPALCYFLYASTGPLTTYLSLKTSYKTVTIAGGLFASAGLILSCFATSIGYLYFSFGILVGLGAGLSFPPGIYLVTSYFVKYRGLANGVAISGSCIGSIIFPPFLRFLLQTYGYRGAVLIMGGLTLNVIIGALFYDPVEKHMKHVKITKELTNGETVATEKTVIDLSPTEEKGKEAVYIIKGPPRDQESEMPLLSQSMGSRKISTSAFKKSESARKISSASFGGRLMGSTGQISRKISAYNSPMQIGSTGQMSRNYSVASNMSSSSLRYISTHFHGSTLVGLHPEFTSNADIERPARKWWCCGSSGTDPEKDTKEKPVSPVWQLLRDPIYIIILISNATNAIGYVNFTILVPAYAQTLGFDKDMSSYLLSIISLTDLIGRIGGATLSDWIKLDKKVYYIGGFLISGISLSMLPLFRTYSMVSVLCALFGLASGTYVGITAVIMADILGEKQLANSYGISLFVNGILQLIGPPICGAVYQQIGSYGPVIAGLGTVLIAGAAVWGVVPFLKKNPKA